MGSDFVPIAITVMVRTTVPDEGMDSESVAWTVKVEGGPGVLGVPEMIPVVAIEGQARRQAAVHDAPGVRRLTAAGR